MPANVEQVPASQAPKTESSTCVFLCWSFQRVFFTCPADQGTGDDCHPNPVPPPPSYRFCSLDEEHGAMRTIRVDILRAMAGEWESKPPCQPVGLAGHLRVRLAPWAPKDCVAGVCLGPPFCVP
jgi:hypothetical protein